MKQEKDLKLKKEAILKKAVVLGKAAVMIASRDQKFVTCPHCWTDQRTERDFCYRCGAGFVYLDEAAIPHDLAGIL